MPTTFSAEKVKQELKKWPDAWKFTKADVAMGKEIVQAIEPFVLAAVNEGASGTTINRHLNNLFLMGGEIIRAAQTDDELRKLDGRALVLRFVDEQGGPYCRHVDTEADQKTYDSTCRKLWRFLKDSHA